MNILVGNDDGIQSSGLDQLALHAQHWCEVTVVAPERQQSARGKSMTFHKPLRVTPTHTASGISGYASNASPADRMFIYQQFVGNPDVVVV